MTACGSAGGLTYHLDKVLDKPRAQSLNCLRGASIPRDRLLIHLAPTVSLCTLSCFLFPASAWLSDFDSLAVSVLADAASTLPSDL